MDNHLSKNELLYFLLEMTFKILISWMRLVILSVSSYLENVVRIFKDIHELKDFLFENKKENAFMMKSLQTYP